MTKILILIGVLFILVGLLYPYLSNLGLGKLPGDIKIEKRNFNFYFPITTSIVLSIIISLLFKLFSKWWFQPCNSGWCGRWKCSSFRSTHICFSLHFWQDRFHFSIKSEFCHLIFANQKISIILVMFEWFLTLQLKILQSLLSSKAIKFCALPFHFWYSDSLVVTANKSIPLIRLLQ